MNIIGNIQKLNQIGKYLVIAIFVFNLMSLTFAMGAAPKGIDDALKIVCNSVKQIFGVGVIILIMGAGATYAIGQLLGAETRARMTVWSTSMFTGAVVAIIVYVVVPLILAALLTGSTGANGVKDPSACNSIFG